jgi:hypothetical protein
LSNPQAPAVRSACSHPRGQRSRSRLHDRNALSAGRRQWRARAGYSDQQIESNRFRVSFAGNSLTARETVERYLLYRAAELTVQQRLRLFRPFGSRHREEDRHRQLARRMGRRRLGRWPLGLLEPVLALLSPALRRLAQLRSLL